jgi:hypothetical protein
MGQINFGASNYVRNAPGVPLEDTILTYPDKGPLGTNNAEINKYFPPEELKSLVPECYRGSNWLRVSKNSLVGSEDLDFQWIESRNEWLLIYHRNWLESMAWGDDDSYQGPYRCEPHHLAKIAEAYDLPKDLIPYDQLVHTPPSDLAILASHFGS